MKKVITSIPPLIWILWGSGLFIANFNRFYSPTPFWITLSGALLAFIAMVIGKTKYEKRKRTFRVNDEMPKQVSHDR